MEIWPHILLWGLMGFYMLDMGRKGLLDRVAVRQGLCVCSLLTAALGVFLLAWAGEATAATVLPFHLCSMSGLFVPVMLNKSRRFLPFMYYLGLPCALIAILLPSMLETRLEFALRLQFMAMHAVIVLSVLWVICVEHSGIGPLGALSALVVGNMLLLAAKWANTWSGGNYMYLAYAPPGTPLVLFGDPGSAGYIAWLELCALFVMVPLAAIRPRLKAYS